MENKTIVFFDGYCNLCSGVVQFLLKLDKHETLMFSSLQSDFAKDKIPTNIQLEKDSIVVLDSDKFYVESEAAFQIIKCLKNLTSLLLVFRVLPRSVNDSLYRFIARNRYRIFGEKKECMIPDAKVRNRFLS